MISLEIPGWGPLHLKHLVLDFNGTLAVDGVLVDGVAERLKRLAADLEVHVVTADTVGTAGEALQGLPCRVAILTPEAQDQQKLDYISELGAELVCAVGNGRNDRLMLEDAALGVAVMLAEGVAPETLAAATVVCPSVLDALDLLLHPLRLTATLRS
nr:ATPase P [Propionibacterium sp.]